jgi:uncharacterized protein YcfJ
MNKSMLQGLLIGSTVVVALSGVAGYKMLNPRVYADVLAVNEVNETIKTPRQECSQQVVQHQVPVKDEHRVAGTLLGAVVGGLLGNQVGGGDGKKIATVGGAAAGGYAGNQIQENMQAKNVTSSTETHCRTVYDKQQKQVGYDVTYRLNNVQNVVRMSYNPGQRILVENGQLVLNDQASTVQPSQH